MKIKFLLVSLLFINLSIIQVSSVESPQDRLISYVDGFLISRGLYTVAQFNIADSLQSGPKTAEEIAYELDLDADCLHRLMRMLASHGIFMFLDNRYFALNEISELLTTNHPQSLHSFVLHEDLARWQAFGSMSYSLQTGKPAFNYLFKQGFFDYLAQDQQRAAQFDKGMATFSETENACVAQALDLENHTIIVDVGGGVGGLLTQIMQLNTTVRGVVYEIPHVCQAACDYIHEHNCINRIDVVSGSFLESIVAGGDLYILKRILHDWDDATCVQILKNCAQALDDHGKIIVCDCLIPDGNSYDISKDIDIIMMVIFGGKERTMQDFKKLFAQAGLQVVRIYPIAGTMLYAIEGEKL